MANSSRGVVNDTCPLRTDVPFLCTSNPLILLLLDNAVQHGARASLVALTVKNPPEMRETWGQSLGWEDPLEEGMATHSNILAWRTPWTEEPGSYSPWGRKESDSTEHSRTLRGLCSHPGKPVCL